MNIVDSQVHIWSTDTPDRPWPPGRAHEAQKPYPISKEAILFQMDLAGVRRVVLVPPSWEEDRVDAFGPHRTFWGTDLTRMPCTYYECITLFTEHLSWLQGEDLEWVMGRGICAWLSWPL